MKIKFTLSLLCALFLYTSIGHAEVEEEQPQGVLQISGRTDIHESDKVLIYRLKNIGTGLLRISSISFPETDLTTGQSMFEYIGGNFPGVEGTCSYSPAVPFNAVEIQPGQSCTIAIEYIRRPEGGYKNAYLLVEYYKDIASSEIKFNYHILTIPH